MVKGSKRGGGFAFIFPKCCEEPLESPAVGCLLMLLSCPMIAVSMEHLLGGWLAYVVAPSSRREFLRPPIPQLVVRFRDAENGVTE